MHIPIAYTYIPETHSHNVAIFDERVTHREYTHSLANTIGCTPITRTNTFVKTRDNGSRCGCMPDYIHSCRRPELARPRCIIAVVFLVKCHTEARTFDFSSALWEQLGFTKNFRTIFFLKKRWRSFIATCWVSKDFIFSCLTFITLS